MATQSFRTDRLTENQMSAPVPFVVLLAAEKTFLRLIAQFKDNIVLGGAAPTVLITAGLGAATAVDEGRGPVDIPGSGGATVATATCRRTPEDLDTFLVTITHSVASGPWQVQIRNNEPEALEFYAFISHVETETLQPWIGFGTTPRFRGAEPGRQSVTVRNLGSGALTIEDEPGDRLGPPGSPLTLFAKETPIPPHRAGNIVVSCATLPEVFERRVDTLQHTLSTNDPTRAHATLSFEIDPPVRERPRPRPPEPVERTFCRKGDGCMEFIPGPDPSRCGRCGHTFLVHAEVPPDHGDDALT